jgi:hypothetical protein
MTKPSAEGGKALMNPSDVVILLLDDDRDFNKVPSLARAATLDRRSEIPMSLTTWNSPD